MNPKDKFRLDMAITTELKQIANRALQGVGLKVDTLTTEKQEATRLETLRERSYFEHAAFPLLCGFAEFSDDNLVAAFDKFGPEVETLMRGGARPGGYDPINGFFKSPDAEVLYLMIRTLAPRRIIEVGSGNSTRIIRQAIADGSLSVEHIAIDPEPRSDIASLVDRMLFDRFEHADAESIVAKLGSGDILFIDSSHEVNVGNDVARLYCATLPALADGVIVHVHDVFLPFDYPEPFYKIFPRWGEQYLLQLYLQGGRHEILWPGYYLQKQRPDAARRLPFIERGVAQSFWFRARSYSRGTELPDAEDEDRIR